MLLHRSIALSSIALALTVGATRVAFAADPPRGVVSLRDALAAALVSSPALSAYSWEVRAREAQALQAGLFPNPEVGVEIENLGGTGDRQAFEQAESTIWLSQLLPLTGEPGKRRDVADRERELAEWDYEAARLDVLASTTKAFIDTLAAQERLALTGELERIATESVEDMAERIREGAAASVERARLEVSLSTVRVESTRVRHELDASRRQLAASWGETTPGFSAVAGDLDEVLPPPPLAELEALVGGTPDLARWGSELDRRRATLALERARGLPNPTLSLGGRRFSDNGDVAMVLEVSLPLPLFDRNQGNVLAARRDVAKAKAEKASAELSTRAALAQRYEDLVSAFDQANLLRTETLPVAQGAFEDVRDGHLQGRFLHLEVLDAQRTLFELRARQVDVLADYHQARADIEQLTGRSLARIDAAAEEVRR